MSWFEIIKSDSSMKAWRSSLEEPNRVTSWESSFGGHTRSTFNVLLILAEDKRIFLLAVLDITKDIRFDHQRNTSSTLEDSASPSVKVNCNRIWSLIKRLISPCIWPVSVSEKTAGVTIKLILMVMVVVANNNNCFYI